MDSLTETDYEDATFLDLTLAGSQVEAVRFENCVFKESDCSNAVLRRCHFTDCRFLRCDFSLVNFAYSKLNDVAFEDCKLLGVDWTKVDWPTFLTRSPLTFTRCILNDSSFFGLTLNELELIECRLHDADLREADLQDSVFSDTDFAGTLFGRTNLRRADFVGAENFAIDVQNNLLQGARFRRLEATDLLLGLGIELVD